MARFNEILVGRLNRGLQKLLGMKGEAPCPQLASEIQPSIQFKIGNEFRAIESWSRYACSAGVTGGAAQSPGIRIRNPKLSGALAVLEKVIFRTPTAGGDSCNTRVDLVNAAELPNGIVLPVANQTGLDSRHSSLPSCIVSTTTNFTGPVNQNYPILSVPQQFGMVEQIVWENQEIVLLPDMEVSWVGTTVAVAIVIGIVWRERIIEESERSLGGQVG